MLSHTQNPQPIDGDQVTGEVLLHDRTNNHTVIYVVRFSRLQTMEPEIEVTEG